MFSKTSLSAIRALVFLARNRRGGVFSPRKIAEALGESPTYMAKVTRALAKVGILHVEKGVKGGVVLQKAPEEITLLAVVEACQGTIVGDYCRVNRNDTEFCAFHQASLELQQAMVKVLTRWRIGQMAKKPVGTVLVKGLAPCVMGGGNPVVFAAPVGVVEVQRR